MVEATVEAVAEAMAVEATVAEGATVEATV
jgi:hypothetical protein